MDARIGNICLHSRIKPRHQSSPGSLDGDEQAVYFLFGKTHLYGSLVPLELFHAQSLHIFMMLLKRECIVPINKRSME